MEEEPGKKEVHQEPGPLGFRPHKESTKPEGSLRPEGGQRPEGVRGLEGVCNLKDSVIGKILR
ncbi:UNVERIFIED_CONTAM: hypothetical protein Slati_3554100 [Sesamum latifolium]|uniref:Uncharacterized protein n=1 Tax=Sesamum latifolium TaxID=2727402 RepID=A0AAW2UJL7_9LAMI